MLWFAATLVLGIVGIIGLLVALGSKDTHREGEVVREDASLRRWGFTAFGACLVLWLAVTIFATTAQVGPKQIGLVKTFSDYTGTMQSGLNFKLPWQSVDEVNIGIQSEKVHMDGTEGQGAAVSSETQPVYAVVTINFSVRPQEALRLYKTVGPRYYDSIIDPRVKQVFKAETVKYRTVDVAPNREEIRREVQQILDNQLDQYGIEVTDVLLDNLSFAQAFTEAIEAKQVATQRAQEAQAKVAQSKAEAEQAIETAKGEAEAIRIKGAALRENPEILQLTSIEKLNPQVQVIYVPTGQAGFIFNLPNAVRGN